MAAVVGQGPLREDVGAVRRLVGVKRYSPSPKGGRKMSEEKQFEAESEESEDVEAHRRRALADEATEQSDDEGDDVEAHRRRA
jgi:hypothetical protein